MARIKSMMILVAVKVNWVLGFFMGVENELSLVKDGFVTSRDLFLCVLFLNFGGQRSGFKEKLGVRTISGQGCLEFRLCSKQIGRLVIIWVVETGLVSDGLVSVVSCGGGSGWVKMGCFVIGHHDVFAKHTPVSSTTHPCPYIAYFGPIHPSSSTSSGNVPDGSSFSNHWSGPSVPSEVPGSYAFPSMDVNYHSWDHSPPFTANGRIGSADQSSVLSTTQRTARNNTEIPRYGMHPFIVGHSSASRAPSSVTSSVLPPYPGPVSRPRDRPPSLQAYFQQSTSAPIARASLISTGRRSGNNRGLAQVAPIASSSDQSGGFYFLSSSSSGRTYQEAENPIRDRFNVWDFDQPSYPLSQVDRDSIWRPFPPQAGGSDNRSSSFRQRHGSERMPSQNRS